MENTYGFPLMAEIIPETPELEGDGYYIRHAVADEKTVKNRQFYAAIKGDWTYLDFEEGTYCVLNEKRNKMVEQWMSDTGMERRTNQKALLEANGNILLLGLGIGMLAVACCRSDQVDSVTALEIEPQVIALVEPYIRHPKLTVIQGDAFNPPFRGRLFDTIYIDIWQNICSDNWEPMKRLLRQYRKLGRNGAYVDAWLKSYIQDLAREDRQRHYF